MTQDLIKKHIETGRVQLTLWETIQHYSFIVTILAFAVIMMCVDFASSGTIPRISIIEIAFFLIAVLILYYNYTSLEFKKYRIEHTADDFRAAGEATARELNWTIEVLTDHVLIAGKYDLGWQWNGLQITIIREGNTIYTNSMVKPSIRSNPFSFGWNKKNLQTFNNNLIDAARGEKVLERAKEKVQAEAYRLENEPEWNTKNTLKRIVAYIFIFILLGACVLILREGFNFVVIPICAVCMVYLVTDCMLIIKKLK